MNNTNYFCPESFHLRFCFSKFPFEIITLAFTVSQFAFKQKPILPFFRCVGKRTFNFSLRHSDKYEGAVGHTGKRRYSFLCSCGGNRTQNLYKSRRSHGEKYNRWYATQSNTIENRHIEYYQPSKWNTTKEINKSQKVVFVGNEGSVTDLGWLGHMIHSLLRSLVRLLVQ